MLRQTDYDGKYTDSDVIYIDNREKRIELIKVTNIIGQEIDIYTPGIKILFYSDGSIIKNFNYLCDMKKILDSYYKDGLVYKQTHPKLPLTIWNYTEKVQYENLFKKYPLLLQCRGLITDNEGNVIVKPITKFFNYEELISDSETIIPFKDEYVYVQNKEDGSMLILFYYDNQWITATRGSFTSEQSIKGMEILKKNYMLETFRKISCLYR